MQQQVNKKLVYLYMGLDVAKEGDWTTYSIYDPRTNKHYEISKEKYDEVMKNVNNA